MRSPRTLAATAALLLAVLGFADAAFAVDRDFAVRSSQNLKGSFTLVANTLMTCPAAASGCTDARNGVGSALNNNSYVMQYVDVDSDGTTFDSSSADLSLPSGSTVEFAGLYWGADTSAGTGGAAAPSAGSSNTVRLTAPGSSATTVTASQMDSIGARYQGFADVTSAVEAAGDGTYTVANVQAGTGQDRYAAWGLVVVYSNATELSRNVTVFDGFKVVNSPGNPAIDIPVSGFLTPPTGTVNTTLGVIGYEGDLGLTGDSLTLNSTVVSNAVNPSSNFFNSTISSLGSQVTTKSPNYPNQLGYDADTADVSGVLANNATSATIHLTTGSETYFPGVVVFATQLYAPDLLTDISKSVSDVSGGVVQPGDELAYTVSFSNVGSDGAVDTVLADSIPAGTTYVPGSLEVVSGANAGAKTDATGDDQAEFDSGGNRVVFRLGSGADATSGGDFAPGESTQVRFRVTVDAAAADGTVISNTASLDYESETLGTPYSGDTAPVDVTVVRQADLSVTKTSSPNPYVAGSSLTYTVVVTNNGPSAVSGATVADTLPGPFAGFSWTCSSGCSPSSGVGNVSTAVDLASGASATITISGTVPSATSGAIDNTVTVTAPAGTTDPSTGNNSATSSNPGGGTGGGGGGGGGTTPESLKADLSVTKSGPATANVGDTVSYTIVARNGGPATATGVTISDTVPSALQPIGASASAGSCAVGQTVTCTLGNLAPGAAATVTITGKVTSGAGTSVRNVGRVNAATVDPAYGNNAAATDTAIGTTPPPLPQPTPKPKPSPSKPRPPASRARLALSNSWLSSSARPGQVVRLRVVLRNRGSAAARNVLVCDLPSARFAFVKVPGGFFRAGAACWSIPLLAAKATRVFVVTVRIGPTARGLVTSVATAVERRAGAVVTVARAQIVVAGAVVSRPGGVTG